MILVCLVVDEVIKLSFREGELSLVNVIESAFDGESIGAGVGMGAEEFSGRW